MANLLRLFNITIAYISLTNKEIYAMVKNPHYNRDNKVK